MERKVVVVCILVGFLGLLSAVLGFVAEGKKIKISDVQLTENGICLYPRSPALILGLSSAVALVLGQAIINAVAGCFCCKKHPPPSGPNWTTGLVSFIVSWVAFILAFLLLLSGAALNDQRSQERFYYDYCFVVKPGVFSGGAILAFVSISLGIVYYLILSSSKNVGSWGPRQNQGIAMGQPQIPPQSSQPVFVHEDTYNRRQIP